jgi:hypothetical protein
MPTPASSLKLIRQVHRYLGVFLAPALLFFAFTGALQTFSLHETTAGSSYKPPAWIVTLSQLHKKQTIVIPAKKLHPAAAEKPASEKASPDKSAPSTAASPKAPDAPAPRKKNLLPMKLFFLLVAIGLFLSTLSGIPMAYKYDRSKLTVTALLLAGIVVPLVLLLV